MRELLFGARLTLAGGRTGIVRTLITALGVGLGVVALLLAAALPTISGQRDARKDAREPVAGAAPGPGTVLFASVQTEFDDTRIGGRLLEPEGTRPGLPPGLPRMPGPGELFASPALAKLLATADGKRLLAPRLPGRVVGEIAQEGLLGPAEVGFYAGATGLEVGGPVTRAASFGAAGDDAELDPAVVLLIVIALVSLLIPVGVVVAAAIRTGGEDRDRRLAALRLVGADQRMARRIAAGEAIVAAMLGVLIGSALFLVVRMLADGVSFQGLSVYSADVRPTWALGALVVIGVPVSAVIVSLAALRRVVAEPLGVVRNAGPGRPRRLWWRLVLPLGGLAVLIPTAMQPEDEVGSLPLAVGIVAVLIGVAALLPWLVERVVARLGAGTVAWQLAVRRLQLDPGGAARAVSGIAVAVAGAIALQMVFVGAEALYERDTNADLRRAQLVVLRDAPTADAQVVVDRLAAVPGVQGVQAVTEYDGPVYVGSCAALREVAAIHDCRPGDTFATEATPGATVVEPRRDPSGFSRYGVFTTTAPDSKPVQLYTMVRADASAREAVRSAAAELDPLLGVDAVRNSVVAGQFDLIRRAMFAGATLVLALIGFSLLLTALEQLRERRRLLAVLVAFGTRRSTLSWSLLWQSALPVGLGLAVAIATGLGLGTILLTVIDTGIRIAWFDVLGMAAAGAVVVVLVTAASLPVLFRTMRPEGLRTE